MAVVTSAEYFGDIHPERIGEEYLVKPDPVYLVLRKLNFPQLFAQWGKDDSQFQDHMNRSNAADEAMRRELQKTLGK